MRWWPTSRRPALRGAAFGLRQSLDTVGAFLGPLLAVGLMLLWANDFRAVFWVAVVPGLLAVALLLAGCASRSVTPARREQPDPARAPARLGRSLLVGGGRRARCSRWRASARPFWCCGRAERHALALVPLVMVAMNLVYAASAYPFGKLSDRMSATAGCWRAGLAVLIAADLVLASATHWADAAGRRGAVGRAHGHDAGPAGDHGGRHGAGRSARHGLRLLQPGQRHGMLLASAVAGLLWDRLGAAFTFYAGAASARWRWWGGEGSARLLDVLHRGEVQRLRAHRGGFGGGVDQAQATVGGKDPAIGLGIEAAVAQLLEDLADPHCCVVRVEVFGEFGQFGHCDIPASLGRPQQLRQRGREFVCKAPVRARGRQRLFTRPPYSAREHP
jgi:hypothetical protein